MGPTARRIVVYFQSNLRHPTAAIKIAKDEEEFFRKEAALNESSLNLLACQLFRK